MAAPWHQPFTDFQSCAVAHKLLGLCLTMLACPCWNAVRAVPGMMVLQGSTQMQCCWYQPAVRSSPTICSSPPLLFCHFSLSPSPSPPPSPLHSPLPLPLLPLSLFPSLPPSSPDLSSPSLPPTLTPSPSPYPPWLCKRAIHASGDGRSGNSGTLSGVA